MGRCKDCGTEIEIDAEGTANLPCSVCGGNLLLIELEERVEVHEMLGVKAKSQGKEKPILEMKSGEELRVSRGDWVSKERRIDRENDHYMEKVVDEDGNVIREVSERLSDHIGHGSAKKGE
jgi:hypothetical protein